MTRSATDGSALDRPATAGPATAGSATSGAHRTLRALLGKELRDQMPFVAFVVLVTLAGLIAELATQNPELRKLSSTEPLLIGGGIEGNFGLLLLCLAFGSSLVTRELDERTIEHLDALPVSRTSIFGVKFSVAMTVLFASSMIGALFALGLHALSRDTLEPGFALAVVLPSLLVDAAAIFTYLSIGLLLSFARPLGWLLALLLFALVAVGRELHPALRMLDFTAIATPVFVGRARVLPWDLLAVELGTGLVAFLASLVLFRRAEAGPGRTAPRWIVASGWTLAVGFAGFVAIGIFAQDDTENSSTTEVERFASWEDSTASTDRYRARYSTGLATAAEDLLMRADAVDAVIRGWLDASPGSPIPIDFGGSAPHTAGSARAGGIRIDLASYASDPGELVAILAHETAHVYAARLSRGRLASGDHATRFFDEGLASWIERDRFRGEDTRRTVDTILGIYRLRDELRLEELFDDRALRRELDPDLAYTAGERFVGSAIETCGEGIVGRILRSVGRPDRSPDLSGLGVWRDAFQHAGCDFDRVLDTFFVTLDRLAEASAPIAAELPRLRVTVTCTWDWVHARVDGLRPSPWLTVARFRARKDAPDRETIEQFGDENGAFQVHESLFEGGEVWAQIGLHHPGPMRAIVWERWTRVAGALECTR